jgi:hypothetical protein
VTDYRRRLTAVLRSWVDVEPHDVDILRNVLVAFVAEFIITQCRQDMSADACAERWRVAMRPKPDARR